VSDHVGEKSETRRRSVYTGPGTGRVLRASLPRLWLTHYLFSVLFTLNPRLFRPYVAQVSH
jgi:hypothetical protein